MKDDDIKADGGRREFMRRSGAAVAGLGALAAGGTGLLAPAETWAQSMSCFSAAEARTLLQMARDTFPHDQLGDGPYLTVVEMFDGACNKDSGLATMMQSGVKALNELAMRKSRREYTAITSESERVGLLEQMQDEPLFQKVRGDMITGIYNNPDVWPTFGYEGASAHLGGYLKRGFDSVDWL
jgi:hypothetical protein